MGASQSTLVQDLWGDCVFFFHLFVFALNMVRALIRGGTVADSWEASVDKHSERTFLLDADTDKTYSFSQFEKEANRVANWALSIGLQRGDVVAVFMENGPHYLWTWLGLSKVGVVASLINANVRKNALVHSLKVCDPRAIIASPSLAGALSEIRADLEENVKLYEYTLDADISHVATDGFQPLLPQLLLAPTTRPARVHRKGIKISDDVLFIYTSGTTGDPKASRFSHRRMIAASTMFGFMYQITSVDRIYNTLPLYHTTGNLAAGCCMFRGAQLVLRSKFSRSHWWSDCKRAKVTVVWYVGELCRFLLAAPPSPADRDHSVRLAVGNGLRPEIWSQFVRRFNIPRIAEFYGSTEGNASIINTTNREGSLGRMSPLARSVFQMRLVRYDVETDSLVRGADGFCIPCGSNEPGQLIGRVQKLTTTFKGYTDEEATKKKLATSVFKKGDAFVVSGDILRFDERSYFYFVDRTGDTFRWRGENVSTAEVASVLSRFHPLESVAVYGVQVPGTEGKAGMAAFSVPATAFVDLKQLYAFATAELPSYAVPLFLRVCASMEVTGTFKLTKCALVAEGFDPAKVKSADGISALYFRDFKQRTYVPLTPQLHAAILSGAVLI